jgi:hypothetical protein
MNELWSNFNNKLKNTDKCIKLNLMRKTCLLDNLIKPNIKLGSINRKISNSIKYSKWESCKTKK